MKTLLVCGMLLLSSERNSLYDLLICIYKPRHYVTHPETFYNFGAADVLFTFDSLDENDESNR